MDSTWNDALLAILNGDWDEKLDTLIEQARNRVTAIIDQQVFAVGDQIVINDKVRPKYLAGLRAKVLKVNPKSVQVEFEGEHRELAKRYGHAPISLPKGLIQR